MPRLAILALALFTLTPTALAASEVKLMGGFFDPASLDIAPGEEVVWTNDDSMPHTVTSTWDTGASFDEVLRGGESFAWTFPIAGDFVVHCRPHAYPNEHGGMDGMAMTLRVAPLENTAAIEKPVPAAGLFVALGGVLGALVLARRR